MEKRTIGISKCEERGEYLVFDADKGFEEACFTKSLAEAVSIAAILVEGEAFSLKEYSAQMQEQIIRMFMEKIGEHIELLRGPGDGEPIGKLKDLK